MGSFSVVPDLPPGLALDPATGVITGSPEAAQRRTEYVVRARNAFGSTSAKVSILVLEVTLIATNGRGEASCKMDLQVRGLPPPAFGYEERNMMLVVGTPCKVRLGLGLP